MRLVVGWTYFSAFYRRTVLANKLDPDIAATGADLSAFIGERDRWNVNANSMVVAMQKQVTLKKLDAVTMKEGQILANMGYTVVVGWENFAINSEGNRRSGHIATIRPYTTKPYDPDKGPYISNVGSENEKGFLSEFFKTGFHNKEQLYIYYNPNQNFNYDEDKLNQSWGY